MRRIKKLKPLKRKMYENDSGYQFVVICSPFRQGTEGGHAWRSRDPNVIAEWLRRALGSDESGVISILTVSKVGLSQSIS